MTTGTDVVAELMRLEQERCRAISEQDWPALERLLTDDLTHTHMNGLVQDKPTYLEHVKGRPRVTERGDLRVRVYGDVAVMNGRMVNRPAGQGGSVAAEVIQVWRHGGQGWQQAAFQASRVEAGS